MVQTSQGPTGRKRSAAFPPGPADHPLTDAQLSALLGGGGDGDILDVISILALSGLRFEELRLLHVADCGRGAFRVGASPANHGAREVPMHSGLVRTVIRLTRGRPGNAFLFRDGAEAEGAPSALRRRFDAYRTALGVAGPSAGIHGLRRWFVRKALEAGQPPQLIAAVIGHDLAEDAAPVRRPAWDQWRACIESVRLPDAAGP
jgi:integrase